MTCLSCVGGSRASSPGVRDELAAHGINPPLVAYEPTIDAALQKLRDPEPNEI